MRSLQFRELCRPWKIFDPGTSLPWLYSRRSKQGVQQPRHDLVKINQWLTVLGRFSFDERFVANHENIDLAHHDREDLVQLVEFLSHGR
jgi:hypothetical protein